MLQNGGENVVGHLDVNSMTAAELQSVTHAFIEASQAEVEEVEDIQEGTEENLEDEDLEDEDLEDEDLEDEDLEDEVEELVEEEPMVEEVVEVERSEEHTSELQSRFDLVCRLLLEKKK